MQLCERISIQVCGRNPMSCWSGISLWQLPLIRVLAILSGLIFILVNYLSTFFKNWVKSCQLVLVILTQTITLNLTYVISFHILQKQYCRLWNNMRLSEVQIYEKTRCFFYCNQTRMITLNLFFTYFKIQRSSISVRLAKYQSKKPSDWDILKKKRKS